MKKNLFYCALAALAFSSCVKENETDIQGVQKVTFEAVASADTRTVLAEGTKV